MISEAKPKNKENANMTHLKSFYSIGFALVRLGMQKNIYLGKKIMTVSHLGAKISTKAYFAFSRAFFYI